MIRSKRQLVTSWSCFLHVAEARKRAGDEIKLAASSCQVSTSVVMPGERPLLEMNGDILWTQQRSSGVRSERRSDVEFAVADPLLDTGWRL